MEDREEEATSNNKRTRDDSDNLGSEPSENMAKKFARVESGSGSPESKNAECASSESNSDLDGPAEERRVEDELLDILDENEVVADPRKSIQGLDSVMRSLQAEIIVADGQENNPSEPKDKIQDLGYLLEASDDELGLPPRSSPPVEAEVSRPGALDVSAEFVGLEDRIPSFDFFEARFSEETAGRFVYDDTADFLTLDGLFDQAEPYLLPEPDLAWQTEFLPAV